MKLFAASLGIYILFLAVLPTFVNLKLTDKKENCQRTCHPISKSCENKSGKNDKGCSKGLCTPFFGCAKMQVVIPISATLPSKPAVVHEKHFSLYIEPHFSTVLISVWHPPKVV